MHACTLHYYRAEQEQVSDPCQQLQAAHSDTHDMQLRGIAIKGATSCVQEEVWSMAAEAQQSPVEADSNGHAHQLAPSLSDVQLVEAFFDLEGRLEAALAAAGHPAAAPQVMKPT